jgi:hypothetical protein
VGEEQDSGFGIQEVEEQVPGARSGFRRRDSGSRRAADRLEGTGYSAALSRNPKTKFSLSIADCRLTIEKVAWQLLPMSISNPK